MFKLTSGLLGVAALVTALSVAQLAVGSGLATSKESDAVQTNFVNRTAKTDRATGLKPQAGTTIVTQLNALSDTSLVIRMAAPVDAKPMKTPGELAVSEKAMRRPVACEAPASVLSPVAKQMESGRCVT